MYRYIVNPKMGKSPVENLTVQQKEIETPLGAVVGTSIIMG
jgi:hypothetical protein